MNTTFANWTTNPTFNAFPFWGQPGFTPFGSQSCGFGTTGFNTFPSGTGWNGTPQNTWNQFGFHSPSFNNQPNWFGQTTFPASFGSWNQYGPWNQTTNWNGWSPFNSQNFQSYGYGPQGWWFGANPQFGSSFPGTQFTGTGFNQTPSTFHAGYTAQPFFQNGFTPNLGIWNSNTTPSFINNTTPFSNTPWNTIPGNPFGNTWNSFTGFSPMQTSFPTTGSFGIGSTPNFTQTYAQTNPSWNQQTPSYNGTADHFTGNTGSFSPVQAGCNGRDAA